MSEFVVGVNSVEALLAHDPASVIEVLVEHQYLSADQVQRVRTSVGGDEKRVGEATVRLGVLPAEKMHDAQAAQVLEEIFGI